MTRLCSFADAQSCRQGGIYNAAAKALTLTDMETFRPACSACIDHHRTETDRYDATKPL